MKPKVLFLVVLTLLSTLVLAACGDSSTATPPPAPSPSPAITTAATQLTQAALTANSNSVEVWYHDDGYGGEHDALVEAIKAFQTANPTIKVNLANLPTGSYSVQVQSGAFSRKLPCLLDFDGPNMYNYAWAGLLVPLDSYLPADLKADLLPSILAQGTFQDGKIYSLGQFDSGLAIWGNKTLLQKAGIEIPTIDKPWTRAEFSGVLAKLKASGVQWPLDLQLKSASEWYTYAFLPIVQSFGGDLINRQTYQSAEGPLNGPEAVSALTEVKDWVDKGYVNTKDTNEDFTSGKSALSYGGHWQYLRYSKALDDKLVLMPIPDFGKGAKTGMGSWNWSITKDCKNPDAAWKLLEFLMSPDQIKRITDTNGAIPARKSVLNADTRFAAGGFLSVFYQQLLRGEGVPRPITPAYPVITKSFAKAVDNIIKGGDIKTELDAAVKTIDTDIIQNSGYPVTKAK